MTLLGAAYGYLEVEPHNPEERRADREVILLLHGTGGNKQEWSFPIWRSLNYAHDSTPDYRYSYDHLIPPWNLLPDFSLSDRKRVRCWTSILRALGHTVIYYSQDGPNGPIEGALEQLEDLIIPFIRNEVLVGGLAGKRVVVICHSRGGILARYYLARHGSEARDWIQRIITLNSPHGSTNAPNSARRLMNELQLISVLTGNYGLTLLLAILPRLGLLDIEPTEAQAQLLPGNPLFEKLAQPSDTPEIEFHTVGGTSVTITRLYLWFWTPGSFVPDWDFPNPIPNFDWAQFPVEIEPISPMFDELPNVLVDAEQRQGQGDMCVTIDSSQLDGVPHDSLPIHHGEAFFDETLFALVTELIGTPLGNIGSEVCTEGWIGNTRTMELHDPSRETRQCQLEEITHPWPFSRPEDAFKAGYDGCAYCMSEEHHR